MKEKVERECLLNLKQFKSIVQQKKSMMVPNESYLFMFFFLGKDLW